MDDHRDQVDRGLAVPATDRRGAGRDHPPGPPAWRRSAGPAWPRSPGGSHARWDAHPRPSALTLKAYDRDHPDRAIFPAVDRARWTTTAKAADLPPATAGASRPRSWPRQFGRTRSSIYRVINEMRARRLLETKLEFMPHPSFDDPAGRGRDPRPDARAGRRQGPAPDQGPQGPAALPGQPLRGAAALPRAGGAPVPQDELPEVPGRPAPRASSTRPRPRPPTSTRSSGSRRRPWPSRTRSSAPTCAWWSRSPSGTSARRTTSSSWSPTATCRLIRAVEKFDYARGNKFSTYASLGDHEELRPHDPRGELPPRPVRHRPRGDVRGRRRQPDRRARVRDAPRSGCRRPSRGCSAGSTTASGGSSSAGSASSGASEQTLEQLGRELGITKERVRQIESRAQDKLRRIASEEKLDLPML